MFDRRIQLATLMMAAIGVAALSATVERPWKLALLVVGLAMAFTAALGLIPTFRVPRVFGKVAKRSLGVPREFRHHYHWTVDASHRLGPNSENLLTFYLDAPRKNLGLQVDDSNDPYAVGVVHCVVKTKGAEVRCNSPVYFRRGSWSAAFPEAFSPLIPLAAGKYSVSWQYEDERKRRKSFKVDELGLLPAKRIGWWRRLRMRLREIDST